MAFRARQRALDHFISTVRPPYVMFSWTTVEGGLLFYRTQGTFYLFFFHRGTRGAIAPPDSTDSTVELYSNKSWSIILLIPTFYKMTSLLNPKPTSVTSLRAGHYNCCVMIYLNCTSDTLFSLVGTLS